MRADADMQILIRNKDQAAFCALYKAYSPRLYGIIMKVTTDESRAEAILKASFLSIWHNLDFFDPSKETLFTWMLHITLKKCIKFSVPFSISGIQDWGNEKSNYGM